MQVRAVAFSQLVQNRALAWPTPMRDLLKDAEKGDFVWRRLQYVFKLPDPGSLTPKPVVLTDDERALATRFVDHARTLAAASFLAAEDIVRISIPDFGNGEDVEADLSDPDVTTGFNVMMRQCYADDEEASFSKVRKVIEHRLHETGDTNALAVLNDWRKAHAKLRNNALEELVQEQLIADGLMPATMEGPDGQPHSSVVRAPAAPAELLRTIWYGGQIHWGNTRDSVAALEADPFDAAMWNIATRQAALDFAHFYLGFALLVEQVLGAS